jgi:hypothetical protein
MIIHDWFGISYVAPQKTLHFSPLDFLEFVWNDAPLGKGRFNISYERGVYSVQNRNSFSVQLKARLFGKTILRDGKNIEGAIVRYLDRDAVEASICLLPGETAVLTIA